MHARLLFHETELEYPDNEFGYRGVRIELAFLISEAERWRYQKRG